MKKTLFALFTLIALLATASADAQVWVDSYTRSDGTYVQGHYRSSPDGNPYNNYSTKGNTNPYTGRKGYTPPSNYGSGSYGNSSLTPSRLYTIPNVRD